MDKKISDFTPVSFLGTDKIVAFRQGTGNIGILLSSIVDGAVQAVSTGKTKILIDFVATPLNDANPEIRIGNLPAGTVITDAYINYKNVAGSGSPAFQIVAEQNPTANILKAPGDPFANGTFKVNFASLFDETTPAGKGIKIIRTSASGTSVTAGTITVHLSFIVN